MLLEHGVTVDPDGGLPVELLDEARGGGRLWLAEHREKGVVGFLVLTLLDGDAFVEEMGVRPSHGRRGLGSRLLEAALQWCVGAGHPLLSLTTFADVPFNAPFYDRRGFVVADGPSIALAARLAEELALGWGARLAMCRPLIREIEAPLMARLESLGLATQTHRHAPVRTVLEARRVRIDTPGHHIKNLFLKDRKGRFWMVAALENRSLDIKSLGKVLGARGGLSFANAAHLQRLWGVQPGAVTPLGAINDETCTVEVVLDSALGLDDAVHCHPLHNRATMAIQVRDLCCFLDSVQHAPRVVDLGTVERQ